MAAIADKARWQKYLIMVKLALHFNKCADVSPLVANVEYKYRSGLVAEPLQPELNVK